MHSLNLFKVKYIINTNGRNNKRYSIELKLIDEALKDLSENDSKDIIKQLTDRRQVLLGKLRSYGISYS